MTVEPFPGVVTADDPRFTALWQVLWQADTLQNPLYLPLHQIYSQEYAASAIFENRSAIFLHGDQPAFGLLISLSIEGEQRELTCFGRPILLVENRDLDTVTRKNLFKRLKSWLASMVLESGATQIYFRDYLEQGELTYFSRLLLDWGGRATPHFAQIMDLTAGKENLWRGMTKGCRWGINWGRKQMQVRTLDQHNVQAVDMEAFRLLHLEAAGRETRSQRTWDLQYEMVMAGEAFMIFGAMDQELVSAAHFSISPHQCYYGVGASRRSLFDKPIAHVILWEAMLHASRLGCRKFEIGEQLFPKQNAVPPSKKEMDICNFRRWFGGVCTTRLDVRWQGGSLALENGES